MEKDLKHKPTDSKSGKTGRSRNFDGLVTLIVGLLGVGAILGIFLLFEYKPPFITSSNSNKSETLPEVAAVPSPVAPVVEPLPSPTPTPVVKKKKVKSPDEILVKGLVERMDLTRNPPKQPLGRGTGPSRDDSRLVLRPSEDFSPPGRARLGNSIGADDSDGPPPFSPRPTPPKIVSGGVVNGKAVNLVKPPYPPAARAVRAAGTVDVQVIIDEDGNVISATATNGNPLLRPAAVQAARQSKFSPTLLSGQAVKVSGIVRYNFVAP